MASAHFIVKAAPGSSSVPHPRLGTVPVEGMSEKRMLALWLSGSPHVTITAAGVKAHFKGITPERRAELLALCKSKAECALLTVVPEAGAANAAGTRPSGTSPEEDKEAPAPAEATEEADERPRKRGRRGTDTPEREGAAE